MLTVTVEVNGGHVARMTAVNVTRVDGERVPDVEGRADYELRFEHTDGTDHTLMMRGARRPMPTWLFVREAMFAYQAHLEMLALEAEVQPRAVAA